MGRWQSARRLVNFYALSENLERRRRRVGDQASYHGRPADGGATDRPGGELESAAPTAVSTNI